MAGPLVLRLAVGACLASLLLAAPDIFLSTPLPLPSEKHVGLLPLSGLVVPAPGLGYKAVIYCRDGARRQYFTYPRSASLSSDGAFHFSDISGGGKDEGSISEVAVHIVPSSAPVVPPVNEALEPSALQTGAIARQVFYGGHQPVIPNHLDFAPPKLIHAMDTDSGSDSEEGAAAAGGGRRELQALSSSVTMTLSSVPAVGSNAPITGTLTSTSSTPLQVGVFVVTETGRYWGPKAITQVPAGGSSFFTINNWSNGAGDTTVPTIAVYAAPSTANIPLVLGATSLPPEVASTLAIQAVSDRKGGVITVTPPPVAPPTTGGGGAGAPQAPQQPGGVPTGGGAFTFTQLAAPALGSTSAVTGSVSGGSGSYTIAVFVQTGDAGSVWGPKAPTTVTTPGTVSIANWAAAGSNDGTAPILIIAAFPGAGATIPAVLGSPALPAGVVSSTAALYSCDRRKGICVAGPPGTATVTVTPTPIVPIVPPPPTATPTSTATVTPPPPVTPTSIPPPVVPPTATPPPVTPTPAPVTTPPAIVFTSVPGVGMTSDITGRVNGLVPLGHRVVPYIQLPPGNTLYGPKPNPCNSGVLQADGSFRIQQWSQGGGDTNAALFLFVLLPGDAPCPALNGQTSLPTDTRSAAFVTVVWDRRTNSASNVWTNPNPTSPSSLVFGAPQQVAWPADLTGGTRVGASGGFIDFSGYRWIVKQSGAGLTLAPGDNSWSNSPSNIWKDANGLHFTYSPPGANSCGSNSYTATEVWLDHALGAGSYLVNFVGPLDNLPVDLIFSPLFFWADPPVGTGQNGYGEIDIEVNRWGQGLDPGCAQFVIRPLQAGVLPPAHLVRVRADSMPGYSGSGTVGSGPCYYSGSLDFGGLGVQKGTCLVKWFTGRLSWWCFAGHFSLAQIPSVPDALLQNSYTYPEAYASWVPDPNLDNRPHVNLWHMYGRRPPTMGGSPKRIHAIISKFEFTTADVSTSHLTRDKGITSRAGSQMETASTAIMEKTADSDVPPLIMPAAVGQDAAIKRQRLLLEEQPQAAEGMADLPQWAVDAAAQTGYYDPDGHYHSASEVRARLRGSTVRVKGLNDTLAEPVGDAPTPVPIPPTDGADTASPKPNIILFLILGVAIIGGIFALASAVVRRNRAAARSSARERALTGGPAQAIASLAPASPDYKAMAAEVGGPGAQAFRPIALAAPPAQPFPPSVLAALESAPDPTNGGANSTIGSTASSSFFLRRPRPSATVATASASARRAAELAQLEPFMTSRSGNGRGPAQHLRQSPPARQDGFDEEAYDDDDDDEHPKRRVSMVQRQRASRKSAVAPLHRGYTVSTNTDPGGEHKEEKKEEDEPLPSESEGDSFEDGLEEAPSSSYAILSDDESDGAAANAPPAGAPAGVAGAAPANGQFKGVGMRRRSR